MKIVHWLKAFALVTGCQSVEVDHLLSIDNLLWMKPESIPLIKQTIRAVVQSKLDKVNQIKAIVDDLIASTGSSATNSDWVTAATTALTQIDSAIADMKKLTSFPKAERSSYAARSVRAVWDKTCTARDDLAKQIQFRLGLSSSLQNYGRTGEPAATLP